MWTTAMTMKLVAALAAQYGLDPALVAAVVEVESNFDAKAESPTGDRGLMQLNPRYFPGDTYLDPAVNLRAGVALLAQVRDRCPHKVDKSFVICYNKGVVGASRVNFPLKDKYYKKVLEAYAHFVQPRDGLGASVHPERARPSTNPSHTRPVEIARLAH